MMIMGGILPYNMAVLNHELTHGIPAIGLPEPCSQYRTGNRADGEDAYCGGRKTWKLTVEPALALWKVRYSTPGAVAVGVVQGPCWACTALVSASAMLAMIARLCV
jgi:hypothetical protein